MTRIVLASASPRREALLAALGLTFDVMVSAAAETSGGDPCADVVANAKTKCDDIAARLAGPALVIAADTLVVLDGRALGKPGSIGEARRMLSALSGKTHQVLTGLAVSDIATQRVAAGYESTEVTFRNLTSDEIDRFVEAVQPLDRAGAYTVDGPGSLLVAGYCGCYQNVLGLPIVRLDLLLREIGHSLFSLMDGKRSIFL